MPHLSYCIDSGGSIAVLPPWRKCDRKHKTKKTENKIKRKRKRKRKSATKKNRLANHQDKCHGIALNDLERPEITCWVQVLGTYLYYLGGVSSTGNQGSERGIEPPFQSAIVLKKE